MESIKGGSTISKPIIKTEKAALYLDKNKSG